jgi:hypothetical protein
VRLTPTDAQISFLVEGGERRVPIQGDRVFCGGTISLRGGKRHIAAAA